VPALERDAVQRVGGQPAPRHIPEQPAGTGPHALARDGEPDPLNPFEATESRQPTQAVDGQAQERTNLAGRVGISLVHGDLGSDPRQRDPARAAGNTPTDHHDPHENFLNLIHRINIR
jgi:hypothetical protein